MINIIVAVGSNGVIGCHNKLLWHISEDLKNFKRITTGHPVVMGRKTFESLGRALPGRRNIVISRQSDLQLEGAEVVGSLNEAVGLFSAEDEVFIIGGGQIYAQAMALADKIYITEVEQAPDGDTFFPAINAETWREVFREKHDGFSFVEYLRR